MTMLTNPLLLKIILIVVLPSLLSTPSAGQNMDLESFPLAAELDLDTQTTHSTNTASLSGAYCKEVLDVAKETRASILNSRLIEKSEQIEKQLARLEAAKEDLRNWVERRDALLNSVNETVSSIFQAMRPDAAAAQLTVLNKAKAAVIVLKLPPAIASAILAEMDPVDAAGIASILTAISQKELGK